MSPKKIRRCVLYVRISLATEESVSIERQIEAGHAYAKARGWEVADVFRDEGVSATHNKPEDRAGWQALLATPKPYDAVVVWKVDRLARRVLDFLHADEALQQRKAGIVAVEDPVDMTTPQGRAFAQVLAVFGELEAATIRARVMGARDHLLRAGRYVGGGLPYGYRAVPNPSGAGWVIVQDEEAIGYVREVVRRTLAGLSIYSSVKWLNEAGAPTATMLRAKRREEEDAEPQNGKRRKPVKVTETWSYNTVDRLLRHPLLAGMVPHNPGHASEYRRRGEDVVRDDDGLPVVDESLAVMPVGQWRAMQAKLAEPNPRRTPRALRRKHSGVLSGLLVCGETEIVKKDKKTGEVISRRPHPADVRMWRGTVGSATGPRAAYTCPECFQTLSQAEDLIVARFLEERGDLLHLNMVEEVVEGGSVQYQEATVRLAELGREFAPASPERKREILAEMERLGEMQEQAKDQPAQVRFVPAGGETRTFAEDWAAADAAKDDEAKATIIGHAVDRIVVTRGKQGAWTDAAKMARCIIEYLPAGQVDRPDDATLAAWASE